MAPAAASPAGSTSRRSKQTIDDGSLGAETAGDARDFARRDGAHVNLPRGRDICQECWDAGAR